MNSRNINIEKAETQIREMTQLEIFKVLRFLENRQKLDECDKINIKILRKVHIEKQQQRYSTFADQFDLK